MSKMFHFLYFLAHDNKKLVTEKDISAPERSVWVLSMNDMVNRNM